MTTAADIEAEMVADIAGMVHDPLRWVLYAFPWGVTGTPLADEHGPRQWQRELLAEIGERLRSGASLEAALGAVARTAEPVQIATASGHGIGKSAVVAWIVLWSMSTQENTRGVVTANTDTQLRTKTWPEVKKWHGLAINKHWFTCAATSLHAADPNLDKTWRFDAIPWSEHNTEAFAGLHNKGNRLVLIFDEASKIADKIWEVASGALTDEGTEILFLVFGNPTRNTGAFRECFGSKRHRWSCRQIDSRTVEGTNKEQLEKEVADYGEDSDRVRVRIRGVFPRGGSLQFIPSDVVSAAATCEATSTRFDPLIMAIDVARFGDDASVIGFRRGRDARTIPAQEYRGIDTMALAGFAAAAIARHTPVAVFVDETGIGGAVVDRLRQLGHDVVGVNNGASPDRTIDGEQCANKGAECWAAMRLWLKTGGAIEDDRDLAAQLEGREYGYNGNNHLVLEKKDDMKKRGLASPDKADQLALTFAHPVGSRGSENAASGGQAISDFDPFRSDQ